LHLRRANQRGEDTTQTQRERHTNEQTHTETHSNTHSDTLYVTERLGIGTREGKDLKKNFHLRRAYDSDHGQGEWRREREEREKREKREEEEGERERKRKYNRHCS
jgi:hypothetical protein